MSGPDEKSSPSAGISSTEEIDVAALFERLREEVRVTGPTGRNGGGPPARVVARSLAERYWPVSAERPFEPVPGFVGGIKLRVKRVLRRAMRWYVEPLAADQRAFNDAVLKLVDELYERTDRGEASQAETQRLIRELEERVLRVERRPGEAAAPTVAAQPAAAAVPDYFAFESRMRGPTELVRERQRPYVEDFFGQTPVLDVGCGRGELLSLLLAAGIEARGVDADADMVAYARGEGLEVEQADLLAHLEGLEDGSLGGIFAGQVVEHLPPPALIRFLELAHRALRSGGLLVLETINPLSPIALRHYYADLTHAQPLVPETLELLVRKAGFSQPATRFLNEPDEKLTEPDDPVIASNVARLNELLFAPLDYAILARK
jgi:O-antigen chain-terminating methyltransferase